MAKKLQPVSVWGIEFDALIDETKSMTSKIPEYPVESGFSVSDTIINEPIQLSMTLYLSNTPVTWLYRHGSSNGRVQRICKMIEEQWFQKNLTKIVTSDATYTNMGLTSISIKKSKDLGYAREISITAKKVRVTERQTISVPDYILKSGESMADAGKASTSKMSGNASFSGSSEEEIPGTPSGASGGSSGKASKGRKKSSGSDSKKKSSILYGAAKGIGILK